MEINNQTNPKAFVLNTSILGLCIVRNLTKNGIPVVALCNSSDIGWYSKYSKKVPIPKRCQNSEDELVDFLVREGSKLDSPAVLFPTDDDGAILVSNNREKLAPYFKFAMPSKEIINTVIYKDNLQRAAERCKIPTAWSYFPKNTDDIREIGGKAEFPCILKPSYSRSWRRSAMIDVVNFEKALKVGSRDELLSAYELVGGSRCDVIVQEFIEGGENYGVGSYVNSEGKPIAVVTAKKIRQAPLDFGTGTFLETVHEPRATEMGLRFLREVGYRGLSEIEFMKDPKTGEFKMIDFNARHWGWHNLSSRYGVNLSLIAYLDITGGKIPVNLPEQEDGVKWWYVEKDAYFAAVSALRGRTSLGAWFRTLQGKRECADFSWDDPLPFFVSLKRFLVLHTKSLINRLYGKAKSGVAA